MTPCIFTEPEVKENQRRWLVFMLFKEKTIGGSLFQALEIALLQSVNACQPEAWRPLALLTLQEGKVRDILNLSFNTEASFLSPSLR